MLLRLIFQGITIVTNSFRREYTLNSRLVFLSFSPCTPLKFKQSLGFEDT